ncbi:MAG: DUF58 domain-containing protein [Gemmatimonadota bacterium]|nr:DUF58 domain-containing protein [Gemmatimonadota bacterium]
MISFRRKAKEPAASAAEVARAPYVAPRSGFLDPKILSRIGDLELIARVVVEGFINGLHRSPHLGLSMDFAEHRAYMPGDDIRRIDWKVYARTDRYYMKEFEADTNTNVLFLLDISKSMSFASDGLSKLDYGRYLAASLAYFSHKQRDRIGIVTFDSEIVDFVPPSAKHLHATLHAIERASATRAGALAEPLHRLTEHIRRRSVLVLISDLYDEPERVATAIDVLRGRGNELIVFHILDPAERNFPFDEAANFEDLESGERIPVIPEYLRDQYRTVVAEHIASLTTVFGQRGIDYQMFDTSRPLDYALFDYLANRQRLSRVR